MTELIQNFKNHLIKEGRVKYTVGQAVRNLTKFLEANNVTDLLQINNKMIEDYLDRLTGYQQRLTNYALRSFCKWAGRTDVTFPKQKKSPRRAIVPISLIDMDEEFWKNVSSSIGNDYKITTIFYFLMLTGLKINELVRLQEENFVLKGNELTINMPGMYFKRTLHLPVWFTYRFLKFKRECCFSSDNATNFFRTSKTALTRLFRKLKRDGVRIKGQAITPHLFRDSFAIHCLVNGMSRRELQHWLDHKKPLTTKRYLNQILPLEDRKVFNIYSPKIDVCESELKTNAGNKNSNDKKILNEKPKPSTEVVIAKKEGEAQEQVQNEEIIPVFYRDEKKPRKSLWERLCGIVHEFIGPL